MATFRELGEQLLFDRVDFSAVGYAEPGYDLEEGQRGIVFADWNANTVYDRASGKFRELDRIMPRLARIAEWLGYAQIDWQFENGLCGGQDASPEVILNTLHEAGIRDVVFSIDGVGQFDTYFSVWVHSPEVDYATRVLEHGDTRGPDPARAMESALKDASSKMRQLSGDGIKYAKCKEDGTAEVRLVSPEEWVSGIKD